MKDPLDAELLDIINRLNKIQEEIGGGEVKKKVESNQKLDRFTDLQKDMTERLEGLREKIDMTKQLDRVSSNPRELVGLQSEIRTDLTQLNEDWQNLNAIYMGEAKKRKSKISPEEMKNRLAVVVSFQDQLVEIKDMQRAGYVHGYTTQKLVKMEDSEIFKPRQPGDEAKYDPKNVAARNNNITQGQQMALMRIKEKDKQIDDELDVIGEGIDQLGELAKMARDEVKMQTVMLDVIETKMDTVHEKVLSVNEKLKSTLEEARSSDKICLDIFCLLVLIGMIIVLVKLTQAHKSSSKK